MRAFKSSKGDHGLARAAGNVRGIFCNHGRQQAVGSGVKLTTGGFSEAGHNFAFPENHLREVALCIQLSPIESPQ